MVVRIVFNFSSNAMISLVVKSDLWINQMLRNWKTFQVFSRFYECKPIGPDAKALFKTMDGGVIAINWSGVFIIDKNEKHILDISFMEITGCSGKSKATVMLNT